MFVFIWFVGWGILAGCGIGTRREPTRIHEVNQGETLSGIAAVYGTDVKTLVRLNRLANPDRIHPGDRIILPEGSRKGGDAAAASRALAKGVPFRGKLRGKPSARRESFCFPIAGKPVQTSGFGPRWGKMHRGLDFAAPVGTTARAAGKGTVVHVGKDGVGPGRSYGNYVVLHHGGGLYTLYAHLSKVSVKEGERVKTGEKIGEVGSTGRSTGPHLHFEVIEGIKEVDPASYLPAT